MELLSIPAIIALVEALKKSGLNSRYAPIVSIILGVILGISFYEMSMNGLGAGLVLGLSASGLYSGVKTFTKE